MKLLQLQLRNFQSYGNNITTINLNFKKPVLLLGKNLDAVVDGQIDSNGSGKSTILYALLYALYGQVLSNKIKVNDLINNINKKNMFVACDFERNGKYYRVERFRKLDKHGTGVYVLCKNTLEEPWNYKAIKEGGHDITTDSTSRIDEQIADIIGLPFEVFSRLIVITASNEPFLALELSKQKEIIEELFGFTELSQKAEKLKELIKNNNNDLEVLKKLDEQIQLEITRYNTQLTQATERVSIWDTQHVQKLQELKDKIVSHDVKYSKVDFDLEEQKFLELKKNEETITAYKNQISLQEKDLKTVNDNINKIVQWNENHIRELKVLEDKLKQSLIFKTIEEVEEFKTALKSFDDRKVKKELELSNIEKEISSKDNEIKASEKDITTKEKTIEQYEKELKKLEQEYTHLSNSKCPYCSQAYLSSKEKMVEVKGSKEKIEDNKKTIKSEISLANGLISNSKLLLELTKEHKTKILEELIIIDNEKKTFISDILGNTNIDFQKEYKKTLDYQTLKNEYSLKQNETNPFLKYQIHPIDVAVEFLEDARNTHEEIIRDLRVKIETIEDLQTAIIDSLVFTDYKSIGVTKHLIQSIKDEYSKVENEQNPHKEVFEILEKTLPSLRKTEEIQALHDLLEHQEFLLKLLTKKDSFIRKALTGRYIPYLNEKLRSYLSETGLFHRVEFTDELTAKISQFGSEISFHSLSSGQRARVHVALSLAFQKLLESRYGSINLTLLDECLDSALGSTGTSLVVKLLKKIAKETEQSMLIVSHKDEIISSFADKMMVELKNGFSTIVESDI